VAAILLGSILIILGHLEEPIKRKILLAPKEIPHGLKNAGCALFPGTDPHVSLYFNIGLGETWTLLPKGI